ncbi:MAG: 6-bladed beta-propeller [Verrucomicrobiota bacterium]|nr:6-bladed beta-propeller [Verrucomicrobiota bacterium]
MNQLLKFFLWSIRSSTQIALLPFVLLSIGCSAKPKNTNFDSRIFSKIKILGSLGTAPGQFIKPRSIAVDLEDNVYVCDMTGRIQKFDQEGNYVLQWQMPQIERGRPKGMTLDHEGNIVVLEPHYSRINHFNKEGKLISQWGVHGKNKGQLSFPRAVAIGNDGSAYVSEFQIIERVQKFQLNRKSVLFEIQGAGNAHGQFNRAEGLSLSPEGNLFVADSCNHRIQMFSTDGTFLRSIGKAGTARGEFSYPYDIRIDELGHQYVCEFGNSRLTVLDSKGQVIELIGQPGSLPGEFNNPWSLALDSKGNLYVADSQNHRVQKFIRNKSLAQKNMSRDSAVASLKLETAPSTIAN